MPFGSYRILRLLGRGAMGEVYLAEDESLARKVALKVPQRDLLEDPQHLQRFLREARSGAALRHHNICPVYEVDSCEGTHYIAMAYIEGQTLEEVQRSGEAFSARQIADTVRKIAKALDAAHRAGVIHRDLKPANIMLDLEGEPIVMDFGLARQDTGAEQARVTLEGAVLGTPAYMSPEQIQGDRARIGPASDIYSLGVILYELLCGRRPYGGQLMTLLMDVASERVHPPRPSEIHADVDPRLEAICLRMLAKPIAERYGSMQEVAAALREFLRAAGEDMTDALLAPRSRILPHRATSSPLPATVAESCAAEAPAPLRLPAAPAPAARDEVQQCNAATGRRPLPWWKIAVGGSAVLLLAGVIVIKLTHPDGSETTIATDSRTRVTIGLQPEGAGPPAGGPASDNPIAGGTAQGLSAERPPAPASLMVTGQKPPPAVAEDPARRVARWIRSLEVPQRIDITQGGKLQLVEANQPLPDGPFDIETLWLQGTSISRLGDRLPEVLGPEIAGLRSLEAVGIRCDELTSAGLGRLLHRPEFAGIRKIFLTGARLDDDIFLHLARMQHLAQLELTCGPFVRGTGIGALGDCSELFELKITRGGLTPEAIDELQSLPQLGVFNWNNSAPTEAHFQAISRLKVHAVILFFAEFDDAALRHLAAMENLRHLEVQQTLLSDDGLRQLQACQRLGLIDVRNTQITAGGLAEFQRALPQCKVLHDFAPPQP